MKFKDIPTALDLLRDPAYAECIAWEDFSNRGTNPCCNFKKIESDFTFQERKAFITLKGVIELLMPQDSDIYCDIGKNIYDSLNMDGVPHYHLVKLMLARLLYSETLDDFLNMLAISTAVRQSLNQ